MAIVATLTAIAIPQLLNGVDDARILSMNPNGSSSSGALYA
jgi:Tfp pilus assembly protein FimT